MATSKHPRNGTRTQADEVEFDASLRRAATVIREVNVHLSEALKSALENNAVLAEALAQLSDQHGTAMEQLAVYRRTFAENSAKAAETMRNGVTCKPYCREHEWREPDGWHRRDEPRTSLAIAE